MLSRAARVQGIITAAGAPLAGAKVEAFDFDERGVRTVNGLRCVVSTFTSGAVVADDQGRFELSVDSDGPIVVRASAAGWVDAESEPFELLPDGGGPLLELALGRGGAIEGRVLVPAGESAAGRVVGAHRGDGRAISTRASEDGTYRFDGLMPGHWHVFPLAEEYRPHEGTYSSTSSSEPLPWSCRVEEGRTTRFDLQLD
ncbi:MAG TPA: carboxypeptidase-like regulatory domain-containing protein [Planctomycetota bacterium]|nr:carboxypeptidase-like regulatory domain-containing protein [Planctomycetota bacterium]